jgi:hypothetical protein
MGCSGALAENLALALANLMYAEPFPVPLCSKKGASSEVKLDSEA